MMDNLIFSSSDYRLDDLQFKGFKILQNPKQFCFGTDSVLLADFASALCPKGAKVMEAGCGNGAVSVMMAARREDIVLTGVEIQKDVARLCEYNSLLNNIEERFNVICADIKSLDKSHYGGYDIFVANPPYTPRGEGIIPPSRNSELSRSERELDFFQTAKAAKRMLRDKGKFVFVNKASRLPDIIEQLRDNSFEPKLMRFVHSSADKKAYLVMMSAAKNAGVQCEVAPPLIIRDSSGEYTEEIYKIYHMDKK